MAMPPAIQEPGLSSEEAARRLVSYGRNVLPDANRHGIVSLMVGVLREPMFLLLVIAAGLYLVLGDLAEGAFLAAFAVFNIALVAVQERRTEKALEALRELSAPDAIVIRDGVDRKVPSALLVPGDLMRLSEGDRICADALVVACSALHADESLLTGEAVPVRKTAAQTRPTTDQPGGDDLPVVYSGTLAVSGDGIARVFATGTDTQIGRIGASLAAIEPETTPLQRATGRLVRKLGVIGIGLSAAVVVLYGIVRADWFSGGLAGISLAMAVLPEEFPMVLTVFLALGALRLSRHNVLTRRAAAIETFGAAEVLCVDKTGTLTHNAMQVAALYADGRFLDVDVERQNLDEAFHEVVEFGILASKPSAFDPMDRAVNELGRKTLTKTEHLHAKWQVAREYELQPGFLATTQVWTSGDDVDAEATRKTIAAKGAPEVIVDLCHLSAVEASAIASATTQLASRGFRVLGVAKGTAPAGQFPPQQHDFDYTFVGLIGYSDPLRPGVSESIAQCRRAGIAVAMITGDYPATALAIGREAGLDVHAGIITGPEMAAMDEATLTERVRTVRIFARMMPSQKLNLVRAFKRAGQVVAMTGDGVNDAPALRAANIGVAMGRRGTDVAREAADIVLLDDDFSSIVRAVLEGRRIYANLRNAMSYILAVHVPVAGLALIPVALGWPLVFFPAHIVFLEMIIDPVCSIVFEAEPADPTIIDRPPRKFDEPLFDGMGLARPFLQGLLGLGVTLGLAFWLRSSGRDPDSARTIIFSTVVFGNFALLLANRSTEISAFRTLTRRNTSFWVITGAVLIGLAVVTTIHPVMRLFHFGPVGILEMVMASIVGSAVLGFTEGLKYWHCGTTVPF
ncbi:MAG: cation-translocating P-type ATPase [Rhodospirillaceae bacterium]|nr:MAG: cation-translocating P-type ATPase [Rhodospirillaceae bacterium]